MKSICERHQQAYESGAGCPYCEPDEAVNPPVPDMLATIKEHFGPLTTPIKRSPFLDLLPRKDGWLKAPIGTYAAVQRQQAECSHICASIPGGCMVCGADEAAVRAKWSAEQQGGG